MSKEHFVRLALLVTWLTACGVEDVPSAASEARPAIEQNLETPSGEPAGVMPSPTETPQRTEETLTEEEQPMSFEIRSDAFAAGQEIPSRYSCDGEDISPGLSWTGAPQGTASFALILDDPDAPAGTWVHWVLFNVPGQATALSEALPVEPELADGSRHGSNSWGSVGYGGPCPPRGTHRYFFKLYALDTALELEAGASKDQLLAAMQGHILAEAELMGEYTR